MSEEFDAFTTRARLELVEALLRALDRIDEIHVIVQASEDNEGAHAGIRDLGFSNFEVHHILDLPIRPQSRRPRAELEEERAALVESLGESERE